MKKITYQDMEWYSFNTFELEAIRNALIPLLPRYEKKITRIDNDPKNEGQTTFLDEKDKLKDEQKDILAIVKEFRV